MFKLILLLCLSPPIFAELNFKSSDLNFPGRVLWKQHYLDACDIDKEHVPNRQRNALRCYRYQVYYEWVKVEVLSLDPPLVKYPKFLSQRLVKRFMDYTRSLAIGRLAVKGVNASADVDLSEARVINGAFVRHDHSCETTQLYNFAQHRIPAFDLSRADKFQILNFESENHHVPHYDYLRRHHDLKIRGNRMASLVFVLSTAEFGGDTIFPNKKITLRLEVGDAYLWLNMDPQYRRSEGSLRGECPVVWGEKMTVTLFIRSKGQEMRYKCPLKRNQPFGLEPLVKPESKPTGLLFYELNALLQKLLSEENGVEHLV